LKEHNLLVLSRCEGQSIIINDNIKVKIAKIEGGKIRVGIEAPKYITVHREEVYKEINRKNKS